MRLVLIITALLLACALIVAATVPYWLGASLDTFAPRFGVTFKQYERMSYSRFALQDVSYQTPTIKAEVKRVELTTPLVWLWQRGRQNGADVIADRWAVTLTPAKEKTAEPAADPEAGWMSVRKTVRDALAQVDAWVDRLQAGPGTIRYPGGEASVAGITWRDRELGLRGVTYQNFHVDAELLAPASTDELRISARVNDGEATVALVSRGEALEGKITLWEQPATVSARFAPRGWLPEEAELVAADWSLPGEKLKLADFYRTAQGTARVSWRNERYSAEITARGAPLESGKVPPLDVVLRAQGDLQTVTVEEFRTQLPGISADLSAPFAINRDGRIHGEPARIGFDVDLAEQPWFSATGTVRGEARLTSGETQIPQVAFAIEAREVVAEGVAIASADARGSFDSPQVQLESLVLKGTDGTVLTLTGGYNTQSRLVIGATVEGEISRTTLARWLPEQPAFNTITLQGEAEGPVPDLQHRGSSRVAEMTMTGMKPLEVAVTWNGTGPTLEKFSAQVLTEDTRLTVDGSLDADAVRLTALDFAPDGATVLRIQETATFRWKPGLQLESLRLAGPDAAIDASGGWGPRGAINLALRGVKSTWLADFMTEPGPTWEVSTLAFTGTWDGGPMTFATTAGASVVFDETRSAAIYLDAKGDPAGVRLAALRAEAEGETVINANGFLPATIAPGTSPLASVNQEGEFSFNATTVDNAAFWRELGKASGLTLAAPRLFAQLSGTWKEPRGQLKVSADQIAFDPKRFGRPLPAVDELNVQLNGTAGGLALETFALKVAGQAVTADGRLRLPEGGWEALRRNPLEAVERGGELRIQIPDADLAALEGVLPEAVVPRGRLQAQVALREEALSGSIKLTDAATRPLGPMGALQNFGAEVQLTTQAIEIRSVSADMGGETVQLTGRIGLPDLDALRGQKTAAAGSLNYDLAVKGMNLPFVRSTGLLVRGDVDVKLVSTASGTPEVRGTVRLRDSLFLQDVRALLPGNTRSKSSRPPYFAVEIDPFDSWRLNVDVVGTEFMRLRATGFNGVASARFQLGGTLGEPVLLGDATIDRGQVKFPFATFAVEEGRVSLTRANPYEPQIWLVATTRRYEFDLKLEVSGAASDPEVKFESTPHLEHGQVLQMVLAGIVPNPDVTVTQQQRVTQLGAFIGQNLLSSLGDGDDSSRLTITSGEDISERGRETYRFDYSVKDRWSITGEYDQYDTHTVGVKWEALARGGKSALASSSAAQETRGSPSDSSVTGSTRETGAANEAGATGGNDGNGMNGEPATKAKLDVNGLGFLRDREFQASLNRLLGADRLTKMDTNALEDAVFLLMSAIKEKGYLKPTIELVVTTRQGEQVTFEVGPELDTTLPRGLSAQQVTFNVDRGPRYLIEDVEFSGMAALKEEKARVFFAGEPGLFKRKSGRAYTPARVERGVASLAAELRSLGYAEAEVEAENVQIDETTGEVNVQVQVKQGPRWQVTDVKLEGADVPEVTVPDVTQHVGKPWTESVQQDIAAEIRNAFLAAGYPDVRVEVTHREPESALVEGEKAVAVSARVQPGQRVKLGDVRYEGVVKTRESVLDRRVNNNPGEPLNLLELERARYRMSRLGVFERVELQLEPADGEVRDAVFKVEPGRELELNLLAGYNTYEQLRAGVEFRQYNLFGRAHQSRGLLVQSLKSSRGEYTYTVPELFGENLNGTARIYGLHREEVAFLRKEYGVKLSVDTPLRFLGANATAGYTFEVLRNEDNELETSIADETQVEVASVDGALIRDRRDNPLLPRDGYRLFVRAEAASRFLGGRAEYQRFEFGGSYHLGWGEDRWWHFAATHGIITTFGQDSDRDLPVNRRFFPGGDGSIRGYNNGEAAPRARDGRFVGAKTFTNASVEFEQMLVNNLSGVLFFDALGMAAKMADYPYQETLFAVGLGVRYQTVVGPIRAEYGFNLKRRTGDPAGTFHFSIGFPF